LKFGKPLRLDKPAAIALGDLAWVQPAAEPVELLRQRLPHLRNVPRRSPCPLRVVQPVELARDDEPHVRRQNVFSDEQRLRLARRSCAA